MNYFSAKSKNKAKKPKLLERKSIEDTRELFLSSNTKPIQLGENFDGGFRDDCYHKTFTEQAKKAEYELFFNTELHKSKKANSDRRTQSEQKSDSIEDTEFDQVKIDKVLVATCLVWDDKQYSENIKKLKYLVEANADINTRQGVGPFRQTLLTRMLYEDEKKQRLQRALINLADLYSLEPKESNNTFGVSNTPLCIVSSRYDFDLMKLMLERNCEPNRISSNGMTALISICRYNARRSENKYNNKRLKCLELLVDFEGPDARKLKRRWARTLDEIYPEGGEEVWLIIVDFCIPNINVTPIFRENNAEEWLDNYDNPDLFYQKGMKLIVGLCETSQKEKYWPNNREGYIRMFNPHWVRGN